MIDEAREIQERNRSISNNNKNNINNGILTERPIGNDGTLTNRKPDETIIPEHQQQTFCQILIDKRQKQIHSNQVVVIQ